ncbi:hypothetical protein MFLAVUS_002105 [Mucor flavus]|uniref:DNA 3'-5' helicase n=1 Tax=Mucor flavus TaxID=439312 RepID=A0ABP9YPD6_9FUNG
MERYRWELSTKRNNLSSRRHTSDIKSGVYSSTGSPNLESSSSNNNVMENSQLTDVDEWIANEDASLNEIPLDCFYDKTDEMYHESSEIHRIKREDNSKNDISLCTEHLFQNKVSLPVVSNTELRPTSEIPAPFNSVFKFGVFNVIQSKCLNDTFYENNNLVISAPTGSGKTVLMELTIIRTFLNYGDNSKVVYIAPTKSNEFTGDTSFISVASIRKTSIIVTTPEKWDAITRRCIDSKQLMQLIKLFLIDEVHILNEKRGACLEACVSRMQTIGHNLRFIAVSATVPNLQDIATWLKAKPITFSEEYRPIKLNRIVYAFPLHEPNMFLFERKLDWKLLDMIQKHSNSKPVLIFCSTRKSTEQSCNTLLKMMDKSMIPSLREDRKKVYPVSGLDASDRSQIENLFLSREIRVLIKYNIATTSTLAVGVNLPAHLVIIKSTQGYQDGGLKEYSDLALLQMVGRAGRPGLDTSGSAVILTTLDMERRYNTLISGTTNIESWLHENMIEHLMSELCLGTITDIFTGLNWLRSTFLYVRVSKNPIHYRLKPGSYMSTDSILQEICVKDLELLKQHNLIEESFNKSLKPTVDATRILAYGLAMDRYYIKFPTMAHLLDTENPGSVKDTYSLQLFLLCQAQEETDSIRFNADEKPFLNTVAKNPNIRFPIERVTSIPDKIFILMQCLLGDVSLYNSGSTLLASEALNIKTTISRITKCMIDCSIYEKNPIKLKFAVELYQSLQAKMWPTSPYVARQIDGIGPQFSKTLAQANMISIEQLRSCDPGRIEMILKRNPPFGVKVKKNLDAIPHFILNVEQSTCLKSNQERSSHEFINLHITIGLHNTTVNRGKYGKAYYAQFSADTSEKVLLDFRRILISKLHEGQQTFDLKVEVMSPTVIISCHLKSEDFGTLEIGVDITRDIKPNVDPKNYISLAGSNLISARANQPQRTQVRSFEYDDELEEFEIDPRIWQEIDDISKTALDQKPASNYSHVSVTSIANVDSENMKKKPVRKKKNPDELCKHRCKNKETCAHGCCKLHIISTPTGSKDRIKRVYEEDPMLDSLLRKKIKPSSEESDGERGTSFSISNSVPLSNTRPYINDLDLVKNNYLTGTIETQESQDDPDSFMDFLELNQQDIESISNFELKLATMGLDDVHQYEVQNNFPIINDSNQSGVFSDPCDLVWQQAGEYVQKVFENGVVSTENQNNSVQESKSDEWSFQSSSLANWIQNYVDIVYDDTN